MWRDVCGRIARAKQSKASIGRLVSDQEVKDDGEEEATKPSTGQEMRIRAKETSKMEKLAIRLGPKARDGR